MIHHRAQIFLDFFEQKSYFYILHFTLFYVMLYYVHVARVGEPVSGCMNMYIYHLNLGVKLHYILWQN